MMIGTKTPEENKDFSIDWWFDVGADVVPVSANSTWASTPAGLTVTQSNLGISPSNSSATLGSLTTVWLSGGIAGQVYYVTNTILTAAGRTLTKKFRLLVEDGNIL